MTLSKATREENNKAALKLMLELLGDDAYDTKIFGSDEVPFAATVLRTTWEELAREDYTTLIGQGQYRLTAIGWLLAVEVSKVSQTGAFAGRLGSILAAMKKHVKGRKDSAIVEFRPLVQESGQSEGFVFNVIDSRASSSLNSGRIGATWFEGERGRMVKIPVEFNLEPADIIASLTVDHLRKIEDLEERLRESEEDRSQFHCPHCDARMVGGGQQDFPEHHCIVTYENYACGMTTADGFEESPCPCGPNWPNLEEFEFRIYQEGSSWTCWPLPKTDRARTVSLPMQYGDTKEEAEAKARKAASRKKRGDPLW